MSYRSNKSKLSAEPPGHSGRSVMRLLSNNSANDPRKLTIALRDSMLAFNRAGILSLPVEVASHG